MARKQSKPAPAGGTPPAAGDPAGLTIRGGWTLAGKHYGGEVVNAAGEVVATYGKHEVNDGTARPTPGPSPAPPDADTEGEATQP